ncbi:UNVERIFIED_CONTAM: hypothetical protein Sangu_1091700 [Sesamum angustifolium]|uniref:Pectinesterase inhibitor domain-containing protein n=1 Tax=Sesamum angustifolium TaxID=2727405 RepID=A0AAW2P112_9LAMI
MGAKTKKIAVASLSSVLLLAMVMAVAGDGSTTANKAGHALCSSVDYKITCEKSLSDAKSSDPRELIKVAFNHAITDLQEAHQVDKPPRITEPKRPWRCVKKCSTPPSTT